MLLCILAGCNRDYDILPDGDDDAGDVPVIDVALPQGGLQMQLGSEYTFSPQYKYDDALEVVWSVDGAVASKSQSFTFVPTAVGMHTLTVTATNQHGSAVKRFNVEVVQSLPIRVTLPVSRVGDSGVMRYTIVGRAICVEAAVEGADSPQWRWVVEDADGNALLERRGASSIMFTPTVPGNYRITATATQGELAGQCEVTVVAIESDESALLRGITSQSSADRVEVLEYYPAPGQFVNEKVTGGFTGAESTPADACDYAQRRLERGAFVSLGAFGGYIVVAFDHSVVGGAGEYDFAVRGNAYKESNEPGAVWVSQDVNRNGVADDEWYLIRGSEAAVPYAVTYYLPAAPAMNTQWIDHLGQCGTLNYMGAFHSQDFYYPRWVDTESYTLRGVRLMSNLSYNEQLSQWETAAYPHGYADNTGTDSWTEGIEQWTGLRIADAVYPDGSPAGLGFIDFVKVQSAVMAQAPGIGEISTEVLGFKDMSMQR